MRTSLKNASDKKLMKVLKTSCTAKPVDSLVFSYSVKESHSAAVLHQLETGFSISMKMERIEETLRVTRFTFNHDTRLEYLSSALSDAAILEIVLQAITSLLTYADRHEASEIFFVLSKDEAGALTNFEWLFDETGSFMTREGSRVSFTLYTTPEYRETLLEKVISIKTKVKYELWKTQKIDHYLKDYLQNSKKGTTLPILFLTPQYNKSNMGNVIPFPQSGRK